MAFMDWLNNQKNSIEAGIKQYKNKDLMEAIVAGCALVASADGVVSSEEKQKMAAFISRSEELKVFNMTDVINRFNHYIAGFDFDLLVGKNEALRPISKFKDKPEVGRIIVGVCCAIGSSDGFFDDGEKKVIREICGVVNLDPSIFQL